MPWACVGWPKSAIKVAQMASLAIGWHGDCFGDGGFGGRQIAKKRIGHQEKQNQNSDVE